MEEDITTDLGILQSHLDGILNRVQHNSTTLKRLQRFEMRLLSLISLAEMIDFILRESRALLDLDIISLCLIDPKAEIAGYLAGDHYDYQARDNLFLIGDGQFLQSNFGLPVRPFLGVYQTDSCAQFFPSSCESPASVVIAPLMRRGKCLGTLNLGSYQAHRFTYGMATDFIEHIASVISICLENNLNYEVMRRTTLIDPLTGVNNRRFLEQRLEEELERSRRTHASLSCLFLDIDFFKRINDGFGHQAGDQVLIQVAAAIRRQLRSNDVLSRYGGEEFVVLLLHSDENSAREVAERIRLSIAELRFEYVGQLIPVTISIGAATYALGLDIKKPVGDIGTRLIKAADAALYEAKHDGRNKVKSAGLLLDSD